MRAAGRAFCATCGHVVTAASGDGLIDGMGDHAAAIHKATGPPLLQGHDGCVVFLPVGGNDAAPPSKGDNA